MLPEESFVSFDIAYGGDSGAHCRSGRNYFSQPGQGRQINPLMRGGRGNGVGAYFKVGGAQAISGAGLRHKNDFAGRLVDKIVGRGMLTLPRRRNRFRQVDIDMIAGPSEIVVIAG